MVGLVESYRATAPLPPCNGLCSRLHLYMLRLPDKMIIMVMVIKVMIIMIHLPDQMIIMMMVIKIMIILLMGFILMIIGHNHLLSIMIMKSGHLPDYYHDSQ